MNRRLLLTLGMLTLIVGVIYGLNYWNLQRHLNAAVRDDSRNIGLDVSAHYSYYLDPSVIVYDLRTFPAGFSRADVFRLFLQFAEKVKRSEYSRVELAYDGDVRFYISGSYFQELGRDYSSENPVYTMRTFPEHLRTPSGAAAFGGWTGGLLGVVSGQIDDFNSFHDQWYGR